jgi:hypothetical protein
MSGLTAQAETASLTKDAVRLTELREFLSIGHNPGNRRRVEEISDELNRIEKRLAELEKPS